MVCILFNTNPIICLAITVSDKYGRKGALPHLKLVGERCPSAFATFAIDDIQRYNIRLAIIDKLSREKGEVDTVI